MCYLDVAKSLYIYLKVGSTKDQKGSNFLKCKYLNFFTCLEILTCNFGWIYDVFIFIFFIRRSRFFNYFALYIRKHHVKVDLGYIYVCVDRPIYLRILGWTTIYSFSSMNENETSVLYTLTCDKYS